MAPSAAQTEGTGGSQVLAPTGYLTDGERAQFVLGAVSRRGSIRACWQAAVYREPAHMVERVNVTITVHEGGAVGAVEVDGCVDATLAACIRGSIARQSFFRGAPITVQAMYNLAIEQ